MQHTVDDISKDPFFLIAEIGVNYYDIALERDISAMDAAKLMCKEAKDAGVHMVKFQTYKAESLAIASSPSYWDLNEEPSTSQRELFKKYDSFGEEEYRELAKYCRTIDLRFCSTAFDFESADYLDSLMSVYKISSSDLTNIPFIEYQAQKGKPIILSVGAGDLYEIKKAVSVIRNINSEPLILMHCVLEYPTPYKHANLRRIQSLAQEFPDAIIGYSDHCKPDACFDVIKTAYCFGAHVVEKHFTLNKNLKGNDHYHAMDPSDARKIIEGIRFVEEISGSPSLDYSKYEESARINARRSIVSACAIEKGEIITFDKLTFKRPGTGISPSCIEEVIGKTARVNIPDDTQLHLDFIQ